MGMAARSTGLVQQRIALMLYAIKAIFEDRLGGFPAQEEATLGMVAALQHYFYND